MFLGSVFSWWELTNCCHRLSCAAVCQEKIWPWESQCTELPTALGLCASSAQQRAIYRVMRGHCIEPATLTCSNGTQYLHLGLSSEKLKKVFLLPRPSPFLSPMNYYSAFFWGMGRTYKFSVVQKV